MHREEEPRPPRKLNPTIPKKLEDIILKILSKEPSARYRTADQLGRILVNLSNTEGIKSSQLPFNTPTGPYRISYESEKKNVNNDKPIIVSSPPERNKKARKNRVKSQNDAKSEIFWTTQKSIDWSTWLLALVAFTFLLGLIPFWLYIYLTLNP
jgi:serine/threonine-protein kinase